MATPIGTRAIRSAGTRWMSDQRGMSWRSSRMRSTHTIQSFTSESTTLSWNGTIRFTWKTWFSSLTRLWRQGNKDPTNQWNCWSNQFGHLQRIHPEQNDSGDERVGWARGSSSLVVWWRLGLQSGLLQLEGVFGLFVQWQSWQGSHRCQWQAINWIGSSCLFLKNIVIFRWGIGAVQHHGSYFSGPDRWQPGKLIDQKWESAMTIDYYVWGYRKNIKIHQVYTPERLIEQVKLFMGVVECSKAIY